MTSVSRTGSILATPEIVWNVLADFAAIVVWAPNVDHSCLSTEQPSGVGTARRIQSGRTTLVETVTEWAPPTGDEPGVLSYRLDGLPKVVRSVTNSWRLTPSDGGTAVTLTSTVDAGPRPPQKLIARLVGRKLAAASDEMIAGLTAHVTDPPTDPEIRS
jgi:carbon monoxide dehydrogenase subunit G